ncbi:hypothetical protein [Prauserella muralis]|uniref:Uncharacterized protein n=1 Tax=Prauserella muralis TaxID=588067 RepID=A0A2V4AME1_9PSEU|nr:hypothetical protein [Prauserella muralis]PXY20769.1 hypothetical protein BAY60_24945 [Prauserella muralis]TWE29787.1 hypothetical protein FHX69_2476 [Prauserella muralis]
MRRMLVAALAALAAAIGSAPVATAADGWQPIGSDRARPLDESQGLASVERGGTVTFRYTGVGTIDPALAAQGWNHIGDPGAGGGYYVEPYQRDDRGAKLYRVEAPDGTRADYRHRLEPWEAPNNSFAAVAPGTRWLVTGEWGTMDRLLVLPMPGVAMTDPNADLPLASAIRLDRPVRDVQGCDFVTATRLLCSSDDPDGSLFGTTKPLLQVDLSAPVGDGDVTGTVVSLGQLPLQSACSGEFEAEGIDYDERDGTLRVVVLSPGVCLAIDSKTWRLRRG